MLPVEAPRRIVGLEVWEEMMASLAQWIEEMAEGEAVEAVVLGADVRPAPAQDLPIGIVLSWQQALPLLQYQFHDELELGGCNAITAWTKHWVIAVARNSSHVAPIRLPRGPVAHIPAVFGL